VTMRQADTRIGGDIEGETAAALAFVRGAKTHSFVEFGSLTDTYADTYRDYYGTWRWQAYSDPNPRFANRNGWYDCHVARQEVLPPLESASRWLSSQAELQ